MLNFLIRSVLTIGFNVLLFTGLLFSFQYFFGAEPEQFYLESNLPTYGWMSPSTAELDPMIRLSNGTKAFCSGFVIDSNYAITAAHCVSGGQAVMIESNGGKETGVYARAVGVNNRMDIALLYGDFSNFKNYKVDFYSFTPTNMNTGRRDQFATCGYPYLQKKQTCTLFTPRGSNGFYLVGSGFLIPGMSGGPVIDLIHGHVIGVNSAMGGAAYITPVLGALGAFGIEP